MNIIVAGGTGFVGQHLTDVLNEKGHHTFIMTRSPHTYDNTDKKTYIDYQHNGNELPRIYAVINLAGDSLFGYWTKTKKEAILTSRIETTERLIQMMKNMLIKPDVFINGSAVGYYGTSNEIMFTEKTTQPGHDFLANVVDQWESRAEQAVKLNIRTVYTRFGVILGKNNGALPLMSLPVKMFVGGQIGNGEQWIPWVHIKDVVGIILLSISNQNIAGPINVTAPKPIRQKEFTKTLAKILKRPYWIPTPHFLLNVALGEMSTLVTHGQYVLSQKAQTHGYAFKFTKIEDTLRYIFSSLKLFNRF